MKHTVEVKLPKLFGKKDKVEDESTVVTQVDLEKNEDKIKEYVKLAGVGLGCLAIGYLAGHRRGVLEQAAKIIVVK